MPPYTAPAPISSAVKIPEGLELAKCGREDCNGYVQGNFVLTAPDYGPN